MVPTFQKLDGKMRVVMNNLQQDLPQNVSYDLTS